MIVDYERQYSKNDKIMFQVAKTTEILEFFWAPVNT